MCAWHATPDAVTIAMRDLTQQVEQLTKRYHQLDQQRAPLTMTATRTKQFAAHFDTHERQPVTYKKPYINTDTQVTAKECAIAAKECARVAYEAAEERAREAKEAADEAFEAWCNFIYTE